MKKEKQDDNIDVIELLDDEDDAAFWQNLNIKSEFSPHTALGQSSASLKVRATWIVGNRSHVFLPAGEKKRTHEQQERQQLLDQLASLQADKQHLQQQLADLTRLRHANEQLQQSLSTLQPLQAQFERSAALLKQSETQLLAIQDQHRQALSELQQQLSESQQLLTVANSRNQSLDAELQALQQQARQFKQQAEQNRLQAEQFKSQVEAVKAIGCNKDSCKFHDELRSLEFALKTEKTKNAQCETEKKMLLDSVEKLLVTNRGLQEQLAAQKVRQGV
jgi:chromosome segregation ATPase